MSHARRIPPRRSTTTLLAGSTLVAVAVFVGIVIWPFTRENTAGPAAIRIAPPIGSASITPSSLPDPSTVLNGSTAPGAAPSGSPSGPSAGNPSGQPSAPSSGNPSGLPAGTSVPGGPASPPAKGPSGGPGAPISAPGKAPTGAPGPSAPGPSAPGTQPPQPPPGSSGSLLWSPDINRGPSAFPSVQCADNTFGVTTDPAKGRVWQAEQPGGQERCEVVGPTLTNGSTYYLGWSSKVNITDGTSRYLFQLKCSPSVGTANHPVVLEETGGQIHLEEWTLDHNQVLLWSAPLTNNTWHSYGLRIHEGQTDGTIQFWYDGVQQTFSTGSSTYTGTTYDGTSDYLKWGVYHPATNNAYQWFTSPRMATSLAVAAAGS